MSTDKERAEELLHFIGNEPRHGDAIAAIVREFENVRQATIAAFARAHVPFQHDTDGPSALEAIATDAFNEALEKHRANIERLQKELKTQSPTAHSSQLDAIGFLLAVAHVPK